MQINKIYFNYLWICLVRSIICCSTSEWSGGGAKSGVVADVVIILLLGNIESLLGETSCNLS